MNNSFNVLEPDNELREKTSRVKKASLITSQAADNERKNALNMMAEALKINSEKILHANECDFKIAKDKGISNALLSRLKLSKQKLSLGIEGILKVKDLIDPVGEVQINKELSDGLILQRRSVPIGVLGVIFESRPDAVIQISSLAIRSGNSAILKGGSEANLTNVAIIDALHDGLRKSTINKDSLCLLTSRKDSMSMLHLEKDINLIIPRGSNELVKFIQENTKIPVLGHADGVCHLYVDSECDVDLAVKVSLDSKVQYPAACNAIETLLIHKDIANKFLRKAIPVFNSRNVLLKGDNKSQLLGVENQANEEDWSTEYLDLILSIKIVDDVEKAIDHIQKYGSKHTDGIITFNKKTAHFFMNSIDSAGVFHNCSTRFADGFRYGFGAEVGISTQGLPPRGPIGLEGLVTYKYFLYGQGNIVEDFSSGKEVFTHKDIGYI
tara:strand:- start:8832 stop:10151 length:1320 start_codon:yes stop_codon:yes gene_type:complete